MAGEPAGEPEATGSASGAGADPTTWSTEVERWPPEETSSLKSWGCVATFSAVSIETTPLLTWASRAWSKVCIP